MKFAINIAAAAVLLLASAPAFAHGGGMGHMGGNMGANMSGNMGKTSQPPTVIGRHDGDHHMHWRYTKTTKTIGKLRTVRLKTLSPHQVLRIKRLIVLIRLELFKLGNKGLGNSPLALRLGQRAMVLSKLVNGTPNFN